VISRIAFVAGSGLGSNNKRIGAARIARLDGVTPPYFRRMVIRKFERFSWQAGGQGRVLARATGTNCTNAQGHMARIVRKRARGGYLGSRPFGARLYPSGRTLLTDPEQLEVGACSNAHRFERRCVSIWPCAGQRPSSPFTLIHHRTYLLCLQPQYLDCFDLNTDVP